MGLQVSSCINIFEYILQPLILLGGNVPSVVIRKSESGKHGLEALFSPQYTFTEASFGSTENVLSFSVCDVGQIC